MISRLFVLFSQFVLFSHETSNNGCAASCQQLLQLFGSQSNRVKKNCHTDPCRHAQRVSQENDQLCIYGVRIYGALNNFAFMELSPVAQADIITLYCLIRMIYIYKERETLRE